MAKALREEIRELKSRVSALEKDRLDYWPPDPEGELTDETKRHLAQSRLEPKSSYVSLDDLERSIHARAKKVH